MTIKRKLAAAHGCMSIYIYIYIIDTYKRWTNFSRSEEIIKAEDEQSLSFFFTFSWAILKKKKRVLEWMYYNKENCERTHHHHS